MRTGIGSYDPSPAYTQALNSLARVGASNPDYLANGVGWILDKANEAQDIRQRNRMVFDAIQLARGTWTADHDPDVFDVDALQLELQQVANESAIYTKLSEAVESVVRETHKSFDDFKKHGEKPQLRPEGNDSPLAAFDRWYRQYRVYLSLDLPADEAAAIDEARRRIEFILKELDKLGEEDSRDFYFDDAWFYVREKYNVAHPQADTETDEAE